MAGPNPTFASCWTQLGKVVKVVNEVEKFGSANTPNYLDMEDDLTTALDGEFTASAVDILRRIVRSGLRQGLSRQSLRDLFRPFLQEMLRAIGSHELSDTIDEVTALKAIRQYMEDNAQLLKSRAMTFDTSASGSPTGTGAVSRLTVDKDSNNLECTGVEPKTFVCDKDQNNGTRTHIEEFEFQFGDADPSGLQWIGTGGKARIASLDCQTPAILRNPSFETGAVTTNTALSTTGQIDGWDVTTAANWKTRSSAGYTYRGYASPPSTLWGLECIASDQIAQVLKAENPGFSFDPERPYHIQVAWQRKASATGTLTLHLGAQSTAVDISTGVNDAWNVLQLDLDSSRYYQNFKENDLDVKVVVDTLATGTVVIDDVVLAPMVNLDGTWWAVTGGATPWLRGDTLAFTGDSAGATAILQYWLWRAYGDLVVGMFGWFPSTTTPSSIVIADPS